MSETEYTRDEKVIIDKNRYDEFKKYENSKNNQEIHISLLQDVDKNKLDGLLYRINRGIEDYCQNPKEFLDSDYNRLTRYHPYMSASYRIILDFTSIHEQEIDDVLNNIRNFADSITANHQKTAKDIINVMNSASEKEKELKNSVAKMSLVRLLKWWFKNKKS